MCQIVVLLLQTHVGLLQTTILPLDPEREGEKRTRTKGRSYEKKSKNTKEQKCDTEENTQRREEPLKKEEEKSEETAEQGEQVNHKKCHMNV